MRDLLEAELESPRDIYVIDGDVIGANLPVIRWLLERLHRHHPDTSSLVVTSEMEDSAIFELVHDVGLNNMVAGHGGVAATPESIDEHQLIVTCEKLYSKQITGLDKYLSTCGVELHRTTVRSTSERLRVIAQIEQFLRDLCCSDGVIASISLVADELLMNGLFNAPCDAGGKPRYVHLDRGLPLTVEDHEKLRVHFGCDGRYFGLAVSDPFGALRRDTILKYIARSFLGMTGHVEHKVGGAGLGLHMVFNAITQLIFNIEQDRQTEVIALFYVRNGARMLRQVGRSLNMFILR